MEDGLKDGRRRNELDKDGWMKGKRMEGFVDRVTQG